MIAIITLLIILALSFLCTRIASIALTHTGLSREVARFQARSAFTGVGFTTTESEKVVNHPVRRRILLTLMLLGNAGIVTTVSTLILTFVSLEESESILFKFGLMASGILLLWAIANSEIVDRYIARFTSWAIDRYTELDAKDYSSILHLSGEYRVSELQVNEDDWIAGRPLSDSKLRDEGILVMGINRADGTFIGAPGGKTKTVPGDVMIIYGRTSSIRGLDKRVKGMAGDLEHRSAVSEQQRVIMEEEAEQEPVEEVETE